MTEPTKKKVGRPRKYEDTPEDVQRMQALIDGYFSSCKPNYPEGENPTVSGLALALDMDRDTVLNYQEKPAFIVIIKKAKLRIQRYLENHLFGTTQVAGAIFTLKNGFGWQDKHIEEQHRTTRVISVDSDDEKV